MSVTYYAGFDSQKSIEHNWKVKLAGIEIGNLHWCDGIGGQLGEFTETELFDKACDMANDDYKDRFASYKPPHEAAPDREPDATYKSECGDYESEYWFKEMVMYCHTVGNIMPLKYDEEGDILDFFDTNEGYWIDLGEIVHKEYKNWVFDNTVIIKLEVKSDEERFNNHLNEAKEALEHAENLIGENDEVQFVSASICTLIHNEVYKEKLMSKQKYIVRTIIKEVRTYEVEADSREEAEEKVFEDEAIETDYWESDTEIHRE